MYTAEQYKRAKDLINTVPPERAALWEAKIAEYEAANGIANAHPSSEPTQESPFAGLEDVQPDADVDANLPNASKRKSLLAPPEYVSKSGSAVAAIAAAIAKDPLAGGLATTYFEPSERQFQVDMGPVLQAKGIVPGSHEYGLAFDEYKDRKWKQAYDAAAAEDRSLTRVAYAPKDKGWDKLSSFLAQAGDATAAFADGYAAGYAPGVGQAANAVTDKVLGGDRVNDTRERAQRNPGAAAVGDFLGSINPKSVVSKIAGGVGRLAIPIAGRYGASALAGAAAADTTVLGHAGGEALGDVLHGRPVDQDTKSRFTARLLGGSLLGAGAGVFGEALASGAQAYRGKIRQATDPIGTELTNAESTGTATDLVSALKPSSDVKKYLEKARGGVPGEGKAAPTGNAVEYAAADVREPIVSQQQLEHTAALKRMEQEAGDMYARDPVLKTPKPMGEVLKTLRKHLTERSQPEAEGVFLPNPDDAIGGFNNSQLATFLKRITKPRLVQSVDAAKEAARTGGEVVTLDEAKRMGFKVNGLETELNPETGIPHNAPSLSDYDTVAERAGAHAAQHPDLPLVQRYLNETRQANGLAERAGFNRETSTGMNGFLRDAEQAGHSYKGPVYRGMTPSELEQTLKAGATPSAWSASKTIEGAMPFAKKGGVLVEVEGGAVPTDGIPGSNTFEETIIPHGSKLSVVGEREENGMRIVTLRRGDAPSAPKEPLYDGATRPEMGDAAPAGNPTMNVSGSDLVVPPGIPSKEFHVILEPRAYDAQKMEAQIKAIDQAGKAGTEAKVDPVWPDLMRAARIDREQFGKAWSGLKNIHHEELTKLEQRAAHAGITERSDYPGMSGNAQKAANSAITNYGAAPQETNKAIGELADNAGVRPQLETLKGTRAYSALKEKSGAKVAEGLTDGGGFVRVGGLIPGMKLRADAAMRNIARGPEGEPLFAKQFNPALVSEPYAREMLPSGPLKNIWSMGRGALGLKTGSVYDSATGRFGLGSTLTPEEKAKLESMLGTQ